MILSCWSAICIIWTKYECVVYKLYKVNMVLSRGSRKIYRILHTIYTYIIPGFHIFLISSEKEIWKIIFIQIYITNFTKSQSKYYYNNNSFSYYLYVFRIYWQFICKGVRHVGCFGVRYVISFFLFTLTVSISWKIKSHKKIYINCIQY